MKKINNEKPIMFSSNMVKAILNGTKFQTRRVLDIPVAQGTKIHGLGNQELWDKVKRDWIFGDIDDYIKTNSEARIKERKDGGSWSWQDWYECNREIDTRYKKDNILWVREVYSTIFDDKQVGFYKADFTDEELQSRTPIKWKTPIFMPKIYSRISLLVKNVTIERLQDISPEDCLKEGIEVAQHPILNGFSLYKNYDPKSNNYWIPEKVESYKSLWESIHKKKNNKESWSNNPIVSVINFERIK